jgi:hypothetical protein
MKDDQLIVFLLLAFFGFLIWNSRRSSSEQFENVTDEKPVEPAIIQSMINALQARVPDIYPVQTLYVHTMEGSQGSEGYNARILFINTRGYFGVQYDIQADAQGRLLNVSGQVAPDAEGPFSPYADDKYTTYEDIQTALDKQFDDLKASAVPGFDSKLGKLLDDTRLQQRTQALKQAEPGTMLGSGAIEFADR